MGFRDLELFLPARDRHSPASFLSARRAKLPKLRATYSHRSIAATKAGALPSRFLRVVQRSRRTPRAQETILAQLLRGSKTRRIPIGRPLRVVPAHQTMPAQAAVPEKSGLPSLLAGQACSRVSRLGPEPMDVDAHFFQMDRRRMGLPRKGVWSEKPRIVARISSIVGSGAWSESITGSFHASKVVQYLISWELHQDAKGSPWRLRQ